MSMPISFAMFSAYAGGSGENDREQSSNDRKEDYSSFPRQTPLPVKERKRNYAEEERLKQQRQQNEARRMLEQQINELKEAAAYRSIQNLGSSEDDNDMPSFAHGLLCVSDKVVNASNIAAKHRKFISVGSKRSRRSSPSSSSSEDSERKKKKKKKRSRRSSSPKSSRRKRSKRSKKRRRTSSSSSRSETDERPSTRGNESSLLYEGTSKASRARFRIQTENQKMFPLNANRKYEQVKFYDDRVAHNQILFTDYFPSHANFEFDTCEKASICVLSITNVVQSSNSEKYIIDATLESKVKRIAGSENVKKERIFKAKFNSRKYEKTFRSYPERFDAGFVRISETKDEFLMPYEIEEKQKEREMERDQLAELSRKARENKETDDERVLRIKLAIRKDPRNENLYLEFCKAEDDIFEHNRQLGLQSSDKSGLNERKIAILDDGIGKCRNNEILQLEKMKILRETIGVEELNNAWKNIISKYPNSLKLYEAYLDHIQYDGLVYSHAKMEAAFKKCRTTLQNLINGTMKSHPKQEGTEQFLFKTWVRELRWLMEQGQIALAIASIQASVEYSFLFSRGDYPRPQDSKRKLADFRSFWESGLPRVGDLNYDKDRGFNGYMTRKYVPHEETLRQELIEIEDEYKQVNDICEIIKNGSSEAEDYIQAENAMDSICARPIRHKKNLLKEKMTDEDIQYHLDDRVQVTFEDLSFMEMNLGDNQDYFSSLFNAFGLEMPEPTKYADLYSVTQNFQALRYHNSIPDVVYMYLNRIFYHIILCTGERRFIFYLIPNYINYAERKGTSNREIRSIIDRQLALLLQNSPGHSNISNELDAEAKEVIEYQAIKETIYRKIITTRKTIVNLVEKECNKAGQNLEVETYKRIALDSMALAAENLEPRDFLENIIRWMRIMQGKDPNRATPDELVIVKNYLMEQAIMVQDPNNKKDFDCVLPSKQALCCAVAIHILNSEENSRNAATYEFAKQIYEGMITYHRHDEIGIKEVHYSLIVFLEREWKLYHRNRDEFVKSIASHTKSFLVDKRVIKLAIDYLKSRASTVMPYLSTGKKNPNPLSYYHENRDNELFDIFDTVIRIELANRKIRGNDETNKMLESIHCKYLEQEAEIRMSPYLWIMTMMRSDEKKIDDIYTKATAQCRWSKAIHLERMKNGGVPLNVICQYIDESGIKRYYDPVDIEAIKETYKNRHPNMA